MLTDVKGPKPLPLPKSWSEYRLVTRKLPEALCLSPEGGINLLGLVARTQDGCRKWLGDEVTSRPQIGFDNAVDLWLRTQLGERMRQMIASPDSFTSTYLNPQYDLQSAALLHMETSH